MADWAHVRAFLAQAFPVSSPTHDTVRVSLEFEDDGRSHFVDVTLLLEPQPMLRISAPVSERSVADESVVFWAVARSGIPYGVVLYDGPFHSLDCIGIGHAVLLDGLTDEALAFTVGTIAACADDIEAEVLAGADDFVSEQIVTRLMAQRLRGFSECASCGAKREGSGRFCANCGTELTG